MAAFYFVICQVLALLYVKLYVYAYNPTYKCNNVAKIILKYFNSFALYIV